MTGDALVTIAIPTFNRATVLERCLESAFGQSYAAIEVVVCDTASSDATAEVVTRAFAGHPRARYVRHDTNLGAVANFHAGLDHATGHYFMWLADDDWLDADYVARCVEMLRDDPRIVLANGDAVYSDGRHRVTEVGVDLSQASAFRRVLGYYTWVGLNAAFYGVSTLEARRVVTFDGAIASDWLHVAELAALGPIRRVPATIHRSAAGASAVIEHRFARYARPIARAVAADVRTANAFAHLGVLQRRALAAACTGVIYWRKGVLHGRDRSVAHVARHLKSRVHIDRYQRLRRAYYRLPGLRAPNTDHVIPADGAPIDADASVDSHVG